MSPITAIPSYRTINFRNKAGKEMEMRVRSDLLQPKTAQEACGKFNFSGIDIYVSMHQEIKVGSSPACDISINDPNLNREHLIIVRTNEGFVVKPIDQPVSSEPSELNK